METQLASDRVSATPDFAPLIARMSPFEASFLFAVQASSASGDDPWILLRNGHRLYGFSDWRETYYAPIFRDFSETLLYLGIHEHAYGAYFDAMISYHTENALPLRKSLYLRSGDIVLDIGVRGGHFLPKASSIVGPTGHVFAIDPTESARHFCNLHIEANGLRNCTFVGSPIGAVDGEERSFFTGSSGEAFSGLYETTFTRDTPIVTASHHTSKARVITRTINSIVAERALPRVDFIILQINGAEREALKGAADTLRKFKPTLYVTSCQSTADYDPDPEGRDIKGYGYRLIARSETSSIFSCA